MANLNVTNFNKLKVFLKALQDINFDPAKPIPSFTKINGIPTPVDKANCFQILQSFPDFKGKENSEIIKDLKNPIKANRVFGDELTRAQQIELAQTLAEQPIAAGELLSEQAIQTEQPVAAGVSSESMSGSIEGFSSPSYSPSSPAIHSIPQTPPPDQLTEAAKTAEAEGQPASLNPQARADIDQALANAGVKGDLNPKATEDVDRALNQAGADNFKNPDTSSPSFDKKPTNPGLKFQTGPQNTLKNIGSKLSTGTAKAVRAGLEAANPFLKRGGNQLINGLTNLAGAGGGGAGIGSRSVFGKLSKLRLGTTKKASSAAKAVGKKWLLVLLIGFFATAGIIALTGTDPTKPIPTTTTPITTTAGDISSCKFTRAGNSVPIKSSILAAWISNTAASAGIPPQVLASVAMHENPDFVSNADNDHDGIKSGQLCNRGVIFCEKNGQVLHSKDGIDDPCTPEEKASGAKTAQAVGLMQLLDIYNPGDLCSITESLNIAAAKLKADGLSPQPTQDQINKAIKSYYNSCKYGSYDYCEEVWQDLQSCQATPTASLPSVDTTLGPIPKEKLDRILYWAELINNALEPGRPTTSWNKMVKDITNGTYTATIRTAEDRGVGSSGIYWCTNIVIDAYNLSGISGLGPTHQLVANMLEFWRHTRGYFYIPYQGLESLRQVQAGYALFRLYAPDFNLDHVSIIKSISIDKRGNGSIVTLDSNSTKGWSSTIEDGKILETYFLPKVVGFGGI